MKISYKTKKLEKECSNLFIAKKKYGQEVAEKLFRLINFIENSLTLQDIVSLPHFHFHALKGKRTGEYAIDLGRKLGYRLIIIPLNENDNPFNESINYSNSIQIVHISVEEVSNHYE